MEDSLYLAIGLISGFMSGMFGIGGGGIRIPLLNLAGMPLINAFAINLFVIPFSSIVGAISHRKNLNLKVGMYVILGGCLGSVSGAVLAGVVSNFILALLFFFVSLLTVLGIYLNKVFPHLSSKIKPYPAVVFSGALVLNFLTGLRGGSGGSLFPPFLRALHLEVREAIATSLFSTIFTSIAALFVYWHRGDVMLRPAFFVLFGSIIGVRAGSKLSLRTKPQWLQLSLSALVMILAFLILLKSLQL